MSGQTSSHSNQGQNSSFQRGDPAEQKLAAEFTHDKFTQVDNLQALLQVLAGRGVPTDPLEELEKRSHAIDQATVKALNVHLNSKSPTYKSAFCDVLNDSVRFPENRTISLCTSHSPVRSRLLKIASSALHLQARLCPRVDNAQNRRTPTL